MWNKQDLFVRNICTWFIGLEYCRFDLICNNISSYKLEAQHADLWLQYKILKDKTLTHNPSENTHNSQLHKIIHEYALKELSMCLH